MAEELERIKVLEMLRSGSISVDEAEQLLQTLGEVPLTDLDDSKAIILPGDDRATFSPDLPDTSKMWLYPFTAGLGSLALLGLRARSGGLLRGAMIAPLIAASVAIAGVGFFSRNGHWIHIDIKDKNTKLRFSIPFPLRFASWILSILDPVIDINGKQLGLQQLGLAGLVAEMDTVISRENPLLVAVDDNDSQVFVYIT